MKMKTKTICTLGILTALYVVMNLVLRFNVFGNVTTDFSYVIFGAAMVLLGMAGTIVGVVGWRSPQHCLVPGGFPSAGL